MTTSDLIRFMRGPALERAIYDAGALGRRLRDYNDAITALPIMKEVLHAHQRR